MFDEPTVDDVLEGCSRWELTDAGEIVRVEDAEAGDEAKWNVDASRLVDDNRMLSALMSALGGANADKVLALRINGSKLSEQSSNRLCDFLWKNGGAFGNLVEADYAYMRMSFESTAHMCETLRPASVSSFRPLKRIVLTRANLGYKNTEQVFTALFDNLFVEELILNGNNCTDAAIPALVRTLKGDQNRFKMLGLGDNSLTEAALVQLGPVLATHPHLQELELQGNPELGDAGSDALFKAIRDNNTLESLNLSNCGLKEVLWAGRLRIMTSLTNLNLSQNKISDKGCQVIASALEGCFCLRYLDLGYNMFGGRLCRGLGEALKLNRGLLQLSLSANPLIFEVWHNISYGLTHNRTLMRLDCTWCDLTFDAAEKLVESLAHNDICDLILDLNPLPDSLRTAPRLYRRAGMLPALPICPSAAGIALETGQTWRKERIRDILNSKRAVEVLREGGWQGRDSSLAEPGDEDCTVAAGSVSDSVNVSPGAKQAKDLARLREEADEQADSGFGGKMVLTVCYGRPSEVLGTIEVTHFTTYAAAKAIVRPLVQSYLASLGSLSMASSLLENFALLDPQGKEVLGAEQHVRTLWEEASVNNFTVLLRPANWVALPDKSPGGENLDDDDELDEESAAFDGGSERMDRSISVLDSSQNANPGPWYQRQSQRS
jgi:hypothetical protein